MIGKRLGPYRIVDKIGEGGMGAVYRAKDDRLDRDVAIKIVRESIAPASDLLVRFRREARTLARLSHPNIVRIYDVDLEGETAYVVTEMLVGRTLRQELKTKSQGCRRSAEIGACISDALCCAHASGVIHRDLKPENVFLTEDGQVKVLDFGLARAAPTDAAVAESDRTLTAVSAPGIVVGTAGYIAPEVLRGEPASRLSDIFALGCILGEMVAGRQDIPPGFSKIIFRCLERRPDARYPSARDVSHDLRALLGVPGVATAEERRDRRWRIVVLPFANLGPREDDDVAEGIAEEIGVHLTARSDLSVLSRRSALRYAGSEKTAAEIGTELAVDYVLDGTVRWARGGTPRIRITPQLTRVSDESRVWGESFDRTVEDVFAVQSEIAERVVDRIGASIACCSEPEEPLTNNIEAYRDFLRARYYEGRPHFVADRWEHVQKCLEEAVRRDPSFALAHAELARTHATFRFFGQDLSAGRLDRARLSAETALRLSPESPRVRLALGYFHLRAFRDAEKAMDDLLFAQAGLGENAEILQAKGAVFELKGLWSDAAVCYERALSISPGEPDISVQLGFAYWVKRQYAEAKEAFDRSIVLAPDDIWPYLGWTFNEWSERGASDETRRILDSLPPGDEDWCAYARYMQEMMERKYGAALERMSSHESGWIRTKMWVGPTVFFEAMIHERCGRHDRAIQSYERALGMLEEAARNDPENARIHSSLGIANAALGRTEDALRETRRALELLPLSKDAFYGLAPVHDEAIMLVTLGEFDQALQKLTFLLECPSWLTPAWLRADPVWEPLFRHPRFEELLRKRETSK